MNKRLYIFFIFAIFVRKNLNAMREIQNIKIGPYACVLHSIAKEKNTAYLNYQIYNTQTQIPAFLIKNPATLFVTLVFIETYAHTTIQGFVRKTPLSQYSLNTCPETIKLFAPAGENYRVTTHLLSITLSTYLRKNLFQPITCVNCSEIIKNNETAIMLKCMHAVHKKCYAKHCLEQRCRVCDQTPEKDFWFELEAIPQSV